MSKIDNSSRIILDKIYKNIKVGKLEEAKSCWRESININALLYETEGALIHLLVKEFNNSEANKDKIINLMQFIIEKEADINLSHRTGETPLYIAISQGNINNNGNIELIKILIKLGANVNTPNIIQGDTPLHKAILMHKKEGGFTEVIKLLLVKGADIIFENKNEDNALDLAAHLGMGEILRLLKLHLSIPFTYGVPKLADPNLLEYYQSKEILQSIYFKIHCGKLEEAKSLWKDNVNLNIPISKRIGGLLHYLIMEYNNSLIDKPKILELIKFYVEKGADINLINQQRCTPLYMAVAQGNLKNNGNLELIKTLLNLKADVNIVNEDGNTPLHKAILKYKTEKGYTEVIKLLTQSGTNPAIENESGITVYNLAKKFNMGDILHFMQDNFHNNEYIEEENLPLESSFSQNLNLPQIKIILKELSLPENNCEGENLFIKELEQNIKNLPLEEKNELADFVYNPGEEISEKLQELIAKQCFEDSYFYDM